jgi:hypothetical protein
MAWSRIGQYNTLGLAGSLAIYVYNRILWRSVGFLTAQLRDADDDSASRLVVLSTSTGEPMDSFYYDKQKCTIV